MSAIHYLKLEETMSDFKPVEFMHPIQVNDKGASFVIISVNNNNVTSPSGVGLAKLLNLRKDVIKLINNVNQGVDYPNLANVVGNFEGVMELSLAVEMNPVCLDVTSIRNLLKKYNQECALWVEGNFASLIHTTKLEPTYIGKWRQCINNINTDVSYTQSLTTGIKYEVI